MLGFLENAQRLIANLNTTFKLLKLAIESERVSASKLVGYFVAVNSALEATLASESALIYTTAGYLVQPFARRGRDVAEPICRYEQEQFRYANMPSTQLTPL